MNENSVEGSIVTLAHKDLECMVEIEEKDRAEIIKFMNPKQTKTKIKKDIFCGICQTSVFCSYVRFDRKCDLKLKHDEIYEVPETFVDGQGIDKGRYNFGKNKNNGVPKGNLISVVFLSMATVTSYFLSEAILGMGVLF